MSSVRLDIAEQIATVTIDRPQALNALSSSVLKELDEILLQVKSKFPAEVRGVILTGGGEKAFVAGADISEINSLNADSGKKFAELGQKIFRSIENLPMPVIAAVNGFALGGGLELALACDFIYASENAKLGLPEVSLGLIPGFGGTVRLTRVLGENRSREMIFSGNPMTAVDAEKIGLVNKVFPQASLIAEARKTMTAILSRGPLAVSWAKKTILKGASESLDQALTTEASAFAELFKTADTAEGTKAFLEKRKPQFTGK